MAGESVSTVYISKCRPIQSRRKGDRADGEGEAEKAGIPLLCLDAAIVSVSSTERKKHRVTMKDGAGRDERTGAVNL